MSTIKNKNELKQQKKTNFCVYFLNLVHFFAYKLAYSNYL